MHIDNTLRDSLLKTRLGHPLGHIAYCYTSCPSTNSIALELARQGAVDGTIVVAKQQTAGRGRMGRQWTTDDGNLALSIILRPNLPFHLAGRLTMIAAAGVTAACKKLGADVGIKWPNDILSNQKKLCGILIETSSNGKNIDAAIIGIGINLTEPKEFTEQRTFLQAPFELVLIEILDAIEHWLPYLSEENNVDPLIEYMKKNSVTLGHRIQREHNGKAVYGQATDLLNDGTLVVLTDDGERMNLIAGEVQSI